MIWKGWLRGKTTTVRCHRRLDLAEYPRMPRQLRGVPPHIPVAGALAMLHRRAAPGRSKFPIRLWTLTRPGHRSLDDNPLFSFEL
jgi:hypothetical protein